MRAVWLAAIAQLMVALVADVVVLEWPFSGERAGWHAVSTVSRAHRGDDARAQDWVKVAGPSLGEPVVSPMAGLVVQAEWTCTSYGRTIVVWDPARKLAVRLAHLETIAVALDEWVGAGQVIGAIGQSGPARGCPPSSSSAPGVAHLHIALYRNVMDPSGRPVSFVGLGASHHAARFRFRPAS